MTFLIKILNIKTKTKSKRSAANFKLQKVPINMGNERRHEYRLPLLH